MPEKSGGEPNLELPSLFGRGRKKKRREAAQSEPSPAEAPAEDPGDEAAEVGAAADPPPSRPGPAPVEGSTRRLPPTPPPSRPDVEETAPIQASAPPADPDVQPIPDPAPTPPPTPEPEPIAPTPDPLPAPPEPQPHPGPEFVEQTTALPVTEDAPADTGETAGAPNLADEAADTRRAPKERRPVTLPSINPRVAVILTGLVVGLVGVVLAWGAGQGCETVRGVGSCGGIGLFALLAVVAIQVVLGAALLKAWRLTDPTSTSFLGVGLVAVMALLFFLGSLESIWMLLVIPVLTAITFLISWWVTVTFVEQGADDNIHR